MWILDRKSTRLNSSHGYISYAVFCLKKKNPQHKVYPYLLRHLTIDQPNQVWCADVTYIPMRRGFLYLVAIMDWARRKVLAWRLSNTMNVDFCVAALEEAITRYGSHVIFNTYFFFNDTATTEIYTLSLHDALPI